MNRWIFKFARRDARGSIGRMALFISSMVLGVAALVSINSFGDNLRQAIDAEARTLLGADLSFESSRPFDDSVEAVIDSLGGLQSRRTSFSSMAYFPRTNTARLVTVRGHEDGYPYYGSIESDPPEATGTYLQGRGALVDGTLMQQFDIRVGDSLRIGLNAYRIEGRLVQTPRESAAIMLFSPRVYIPLAQVDTTLLAQGSRATYEVYFRFEDGRDADAIVEDLGPSLREARVGTDTVSEEQGVWSRALTNLYRFLGLVGFTALLLGSLGVASSVNVYVRQRIQTVAVLRCFGASSWSTVGVYLIQAFGMGLLGAVLGSLIGVGIQSFIPVVLADFLPVDVTFSISWGAVLLGSGVGLGVTLLFALLPLLSVRKISPLSALRSEYDTSGNTKRDPLWWLSVFVVIVGMSVFAIIQAPSLQFGIAYTVAILFVFLLLAGTARLVMWLLLRRPPSGASYVIRQGVANLYRPHNQTLMMVLALGFGTFLVTTMLLSEQTLLGQIDLATGGDRPNLVFYDVQPDQVEDVTSAISSASLPVLDNVAMISMRVLSVKGTTVEEMRADSTLSLSWAHRREYRSTYRGELIDTEVLVEGSFAGSYSGSGPIPVSIESDVASELHVEIGDELIFDVQGIPVTTEISSVREVNWQRMQTNFFFVFPKGSLESAPATHVVMTRTESEEESAGIQSTIVQSHPNISSLDISVVLGVFEAIFSRVAFVARFMGLFSVLTGLIVLSGAVLISRFQRIEESVLLKTLGASRKTVLRIMSVEYLVLGVVGSITGTILALGAGWSISRWVFEASLVIEPLPIGLVAVSVVALTILIGRLNSRGVYDKSALEVLRSEL